MPSYEKNKSSGLWSVRFREISPVDGSTHQKRLSGFETKKAAQYGYEDYIAEQKKSAAEKKLEEAKEPAQSRLTFDDLISAYYRFEKARIKESSYYDLYHKAKGKIEPFFCGRRISDITPATVLEWQQTLEGYSFAYKKKLVNMLAAIYNYGEKYYDIPNIMNKVDRPRNLEAKKEMLFWTPEEFSKFISCVDRPEYAALFRFLYVTGCRRGEALSLSWSDIDFKKGIVKINKNVTFKTEDKSSPYHITTPKNASSNRNIALPSFFLDMMKEYKEWQKNNATQTDFVFGGDSPLRPTSVARVMDAAILAAGVKRIRVHDLRHSCASFLIHKGVSVVAVSRRMGHTNIEQTLNTYSHMLPDDQTMILNSFASVSDLLT